MRLFLLVSCLFATALSQSVGNLKAEEALAITIQSCTAPGSCATENGGVVLDSNWRWAHLNSGATNCYTGNVWDQTYCPDPTTCTTNCAIDGIPQADWSSTYGGSTVGNAFNLRFVTQGPYSKNIGARTYLLDSTKQQYRMFKLLNQEFAFDVDVSTLGCGLNGALYFVEMDADGGKARYPTNKGGAAYGTGYCDAQCPHDVKWINGKANSDKWVPSATDVNSGTGRYGSCCAELDIWEANSISQAFTTHPCSVDGQTQCEGVQCGDNADGNRYKGVCDKDGCDFASYRLGDKNFFGPGASFKVDTTKPFTVVTQFLTTDGTANGDLSEIRRFYVQNGKKIENSKVNFPGVTAHSSLTEKFCDETKALFGDVNDHSAKGGLKKMGQAMKKGMVLVMSLWDDHDVNMLWLDSNYPPTGDASKPGIARGSCATTSGVPSEVEASQASATVKFSNIKVGAIGSTTF
jgi:cellulose 1,4-beta-cellobiosidase